MKLIIDIPEETKQVFDKAESNDLKGGYYDHGGVIGKAIQNGIPLDDVKAKIVDRAIVSTNGTDVDGFIFLGRLLRIFDEIGKPESEVNPNETDN